MATTKKATKRGPGRPEKSETVPVKVRRTRARRTISQYQQDLAAAKRAAVSTTTVVTDADVEAAFADSNPKTASIAAQLSESLRPHVKGVDAILAQCEAAGVPRQEAEYMRSRFYTAHTELMLALARAP